MKNINVVTIAEIMLLLGVLSIVIAAFLVDLILGLVTLGVSLIVLGVVLLKAAALKGGVK